MLGFGSLLRRLRGVREDDERGTAEFCRVVRLVASINKCIVFKISPDSLGLFCLTLAVDLNSVRLLSPIQRSLTSVTRSYNQLPLPPTYLHFDLSLSSLSDVPILLTL